MFNVEYDILDEVKIGTGTHLRLVESIVSKKKVIQLWSTLSSTWTVMYRHQVEDVWADWKKLALSIKKRSKKSKKSS